MDNNTKLKNKNPEYSRNVFSLLTFSWLIKIFRQSLNDGLKVHDLFDTLESHKSNKLGDALQNLWNNELEKTKRKGKSPNLLWAIFKLMFPRFYVFGILLFILMTMIRPLNPMFLGEFINLFAAKDAEEDKTESLQGMCLYGGLILLCLLISIFSTHYINYAMNQTGMQVRTACCSLIYRKMLRLSQKSLNESTVGQIVNLVSNDVNRFDRLAYSFHFLWITPIHLVLVTYLVWRYIGVSAFIGVGTLIVSTIPVHGIITKISSLLRLKIAERTDDRIKKMTEIISGIRVIKMYAWEKPFVQIVNAARVVELKFLKYISYIQGTVFSSYVFIERCILFISTVSYVSFGNTLTADRVFSMAQFFNIMQYTIAIQLPMAAYLGAETLVSIRRLQQFLMLEEKPEKSTGENLSNGISLKDIQASWTPGTKILNGVSIQIPNGTLCAVVGGVGQGKSTLLQLLLGELLPENGTMEICGDLSYSAQEAWLFVSTVRKNILFGQQYDSYRYSNVVKVCALERDFNLFPYGDQTLVGEKGISLSGGQKARINLARAVYRDADIYLLDDPLSAVDAHVGKHLFEECIVGFLKNKTRILVTHQLQYLKKADHIVVINNGKVEAQGSYFDLLKQNIDFVKMVTIGDDVDNTSNTKRQSEAQNVPKRRVSTLSTLSQNFEQAVEGAQCVQEAETEEKAGESGAHAYKEYAKSGGNTCSIIFFIFLCIAGQAATNAADLWVTFWTKQETTCLRKYDSEIEVVPLNSSGKYDNHSMSYYDVENNPEEELPDFCDNILSRNLVIYVYTGIILLSISLLLSRAIYFYKLSISASKNLHNKMFTCLSYAPMRFFDRNPSGRVLNRFSRDIGIIDEILPRVILEAIQIISVSIGILLMTFLTNVFMIIIAVMLGVIIYKLIQWYLLIARNIKHLEGITKSPVFSHISASLNGITTIRSTALEPTLMREYDLHQDNHTSAWNLVLGCSTAFALWFDLLTFTFVASLTGGFIIMYHYGVTSGSEVGLALSQSLILTGMIQYGLRQAADVVSYMTSVERVLEYTRLEKEEPQETSPDIVLPEPWPSCGTIVFKNAYLRYCKTEAPILKNLNFAVGPGEKIGIVGRTGAGKSSLITALFKLAHLEGSVTIDGIDIQYVGLHDLRKGMSIIPQDPVLFSATLRYNIDPFEEFSDGAIWKALEEVELKDIAPSLNYLVQEGGNNFSVGQRQLICLARTILRNNKILILDEATANVDPKTDALIQNTIRNKFCKCTVLTIAHRLNTVMDMDKVLVMSAGCVVEYDHPYKLLNNSNGYLYSMVAQTGSAMAAQLHDIAESTYLKLALEEIESSSL